MARASRNLFILAAAFVLGGVATSAFAQSGKEFGDRINKAFEQLNKDIKDCKPIDLRPYDSLLKEARDRQKAAAVAIKAKAPFEYNNMVVINVQVDDAMELYAKAHQAWVRQQVEKAMKCTAPPKTTAPPEQKQAKADQPAQPGGQPATEGPKTNYTDSLEPPTLKQADPFKTQSKPIPQTPSAQSSMTLPVPAFAQPILAVHNAERLEFGAPPLEWDPQLATAAIAYAQQLADGAPYVHSPRTGREDQRENLSRGLRGARPEQMMRIWTNEKRYFHAGVFPDVSTTGDANDVLHYTQMIWRTTTRLGCGVANGKAGAFMVCRYSPPGNAPGKAIP